jgi:uncharacterized protein YjiS (DUF1127 family)
MNFTSNTLDSDSIQAGRSHVAQSWLGGLIESVRAAAAARSLRSTLATMDDNQLRDIGVADDEIYRIRRQDSFTPQAWR